MQLTVRDVAELLNVAEKTIYRWLKKGEIPAYKINDTYRFNRADLLEWANSKRMNVSPDIIRESSDAAGPAISISEAISSGGIHYRVNGTSKEAVLKSMVDVIRLPDKVNREQLFMALLSREQLGSTGIGNGIAIPHVRNPIILQVEKPSINLCFLEQAIEFEALDSQPVSILFMIISSTVRTHLRILSRLAFVLRNDTLLRVLHDHASREKIMEAIMAAETAVTGGQA